MTSHFEAAVQCPGPLPTESLLHEVLTGFSMLQKSLPAKFLYDTEGSVLFEEICGLEEYYPTRVEKEILRECGDELSRSLDPVSLIIEPGSGNGEKIREILPSLLKTTEHLTYVPIEISQKVLVDMTDRLHEEFIELKVLPVWADFMGEVELPLSVESVQGPKAVFFPGSTIGNFHPSEAISFLKKYRKFIERGGHFLIGVDLKKDPEILKKAYDDARGVTAAFNLNVLKRLNREVEANFDLQKFSHEVRYNEALGRIEMHLVSQLNQLVRIQDTVFRLNEGESIHTENSYKYTAEEFAELGAKAQLKLVQHWSDSEQLFGVFLFKVDSF